MVVRRAQRAEETDALMNADVQRTVMRGRNDIDVAEHGLLAAGIEIRFAVVPDHAACGGNGADHRSAEHHRCPRVFRAAHVQIAEDDVVAVRGVFQINGIADRVFVHITCFRVDRTILAEQQTVISVVA